MHVSAATMAKVIKLMQGDRKIAAIKELRTATGATLKDAKAYVDALPVDFQPAAAAAPAAPKGTLPSTTLTSEGDNTLRVEQSVSTGGLFFSAKNPLSYKIISGHFSMDDTRKLHALLSNFLDGKTETATTFKVGDRVKVTKNRANSADVKAGDLGTISRKDGPDFKVTMDDGEYWYIAPEFLELALVPAPKPGETTTPDGFNVGDKVKLTGYVGGGPGNGDTGTIKRTGYDSETWGVKVDGYSSGGYFGSGVFSVPVGKMEKDVPTLPLAIGARVETTGEIRKRTGKVVAIAGDRPHDLVTLVLDEADRGDTEWRSYRKNVTVTEAAVELPDPKDLPADYIARVVGHIVTKAVSA